MTASPRIDVRLANDTWESLLAAHSALTGSFAAENIWSEASMTEYDVLYTLAKGDGPMRICEVQEGVLLSQPALSRMIDRLVTRGLLSRAIDPDDGRAVRVSLTEDGARVQREIGRAHAKSVAQQVGAALTAEEMAELRRLTQKLTGSGS